MLPCSIDWINREERSKRECEDSENPGSGDDPIGGAANGRCDGVNVVRDI